MVVSTAIALTLFFMLFSVASVCSFNRFRLAISLRNGMDKLHALFGQRRHRAESSSEG